MRFGSMFIPAVCVLFLLKLFSFFNIQFAAVKVWNNLDESIKYLPLIIFKNKVAQVKLNISQSY